MQEKKIYVFHTPVGKFKRDKVLLKYHSHILMMVDHKYDSPTVPAKTMRIENKTKPQTTEKQNFAKVPFPYYVASTKLPFQNLTQKLRRS